MHKLSVPKLGTVRRVLMSKFYMKHTKCNRLFSLWLCLHTSLIHTLTSSSSSYAFLSHTSLSQSEQDEDHFSNKTKFKKMFTHMCHCMPHSRIEYLVELRSYLLLELEEFYIESQHISLNIHL